MIRYFAQKFQNKSRFFVQFAEIPITLLTFYPACAIIKTQKERGLTKWLALTMPMTDRAAKN